MSEATRHYLSLLGGTDDQLSMVGVKGINLDNYMDIINELKKDIGRIWTLTELQVEINSILSKL